MIRMMRGRPRRANDGQAYRWLRDCGMVVLPLRAIGTALTPLAVVGIELLCGSSLFDLRTYG